MSEQRKVYLNALIRESIRVLKEQDPGALPLPPGGSAVPPSPVPPAAATNASATPPGPPPVDPNAAPQTGDAKPFDVDSMIERLNVIRGGKSFADPEVYGQVTSFFKALNDADKAVIDRFLQSIGKIVIQVDATQQGSGGNAQPPMQQAPMAPAPVAAAPAPGM